MEESQSNKNPNEDDTDIPDFSFEATDFQGRIVYLPPGRWKWKIIEAGAHYDLLGYEKQVMNTAIDPDLVAFEQGTEDIEIHASYDVGTGIYSKKYLWVPIKYVGERGKVITAYWVENIKKSVKRIIWRKK